MSARRAPAPCRTWPAGSRSRWATASSPWRTPTRPGSAAADKTAGGDGRPARRDRAGAPGPRRAARLSAVQALYQMNLSQVDVETLIGEFVGHRLGREIDGQSYGQPDT